MRFSFRGSLKGALLVVLALCLSSLTATAQKKGAASPRAKDAARHAREAATVFNQIMRVPDKGIPRELLEKAEAVAVFPNVLKAAFVVGGNKGQGVVARRMGKGWGAPTFFNLGGGSIGPQIGASSTDFVLLIMNEEGLKGLLEDKFEIGGETSIAAGPIGRTLSASTNATLDAGILSYSRSKGAFIGAALKGVAITPDNDLNESYYGKKANEVLLDSKMATPALVRTFTLALNRYSVRK